MVAYLKRFDSEGAARHVCTCTCKQISIYPTSLPPTNRVCCKTGTVLVVWGKKGHRPGRDRSRVPVPSRRPVPRTPGPRPFRRPPYANMI